MLDEPIVVPRGTPTDHGRPWPTSALTALLAKVDSGQWTMKQGIVARLRFRTGEARPSDFYGYSRFQGGHSDHSDTLVLAQHCVRGREDDAVRREVRRLLDVVFPSIERLTRYSAPAEQPPAPTPPAP